jgi:5-methylthioadenosine/S-adenosylhomocysteine deaminase
VGIEDEDIVFVGQRGSEPAGDVTDLGNAVLVPGLVNAHSHLDLTVLRGALPTDDFFSWIRGLVDLKQRQLDGKTLALSARAGLAEGVRAGITTYGDTSDSSAAFHAMIEAGVRGVAFQEVFGPDPAQSGEAVQALMRRVDELRAMQTVLVTPGISPHAPYTVSDELYRACAELALRERLPIAVHVAESSAETEYVVHGRGPFAELLRTRGLAVAPRAASPIALLHATGVLGARPLLIHAIATNGTDWEIIRGAGAAVAHCPVSNAILGHAAAPLDRYLERGSPCALGSDSMAANVAMDMLEEARHAAGSPDAARRLEMLTIDGARALGLQSLIGTLEPGKRADMAAFSLRRVDSTGAFDPVEALVGSVTGADAILAMVNGRELDIDRS